MRCVGPVVAVVALVSAGCPFDAGTPPGAVLLCHDDAECAPGDVCDLASHVCGKPGESTVGPRVVSASFSPAAAKDGVGVTLAIDADAAIDESTAPVLTFASVGGSAPTFVLGGGASSASTHVELHATVDASFAEGYYVLESVALSDAAHHVEVTPVDGASFKVDRTAPRIEDLSVDAGGALGAGVASDQSGTNDVTVGFVVDEPVGVVTALVGSFALDCTTGAALAVTCSGSLDGTGVVDGENALVVNATDLAGNHATAADQVAVDLAPPAVVAGSVTVTVDGSASAPFAVTGSAVDVEILFDEPLRDPPAVSLSSGESFTPVSNNGNFYRLHTRVGPVAVDGLVSVFVDAADRFGHRASAPIVVPLPAPYGAGIPVQTEVTSPCTIPALANGSTCTDFDGDGFFGPSNGCTPNPVDCDDGRAAVFPGAPEIPGDGINNDCSGGDESPLDGIYVDAAHGDDNGDATAGSPVSTLTEAFFRLSSSNAGQPILLAAGTYPLEGSDASLTTTIVGGFTFPAWTREGAVSRISLVSSTCDEQVTLSAPLALVGVHIAQSVTVRAGPSVLEDVVVEGCAGVSVIAPAVLLRVDASGGDGFAGVAGVRVIDSTLRSFEVSASGVSILRSTISSALIVTGGNVDVVDSLIVAPNTGVAVGCQGCAGVRIYYSNILGEAGEGVVGVSGLQTSDIEIVSSQLRARATSDLVNAGFNASVSMRNNLIDQPGGVLVNGDVPINNDVAGLATLNACNYVGCVFGGGNKLGTLSAQADLLHAGTNPDGADYADDDPPVDAPTSIAGDIDGACRFADGHDDIGPDEL